MRGEASMLRCLKTAAAVQQHVFPLDSSATYTPARWLEDLQRFRASNDAASSRVVAPHLLYPLHFATRSGRADIVRLMLEKGYEDLDGDGDAGLSPLQIAVCMGHMAITRALLAAGADASLRCEAGMSALDLAAFGNHVDIARVIIEHGVDASAAGPQGWTSLHVGANVGNADIVSLLCLEGASVDARDGQGSTPLLLTAYRDHVPATRALLTAGADVTLRALGDGKSALDIAASEGHVEIARALIEHGVDANAAAEDGNTALHFAAASGRTEVVALLCLDGAAAVDVVDESGCTPILVAATRGNVAVAQALLAAGADVTLREDTLDLSPLDLAAGAGHVDVLRTLVEHGGNVNAVSRDGLTALHVAACRNKAEVTDALVEAGADVDADEVEQGITPLHIAANCCYLPNVLALLQHGANVGKRNARGQTPLHVAAAAGTAGNLGAAKVVDLLLRHGADEKAIDNNGQTAVDRIRTHVQGQEEHLAEGVERVLELLANAPADRAWRRRGFLILCRAHYPSGGVLLEQVGNHTIAKRTRSRAQASRAEVDWAGMANMLMGAGADSISLMGVGADIIFEAIVSFL